MTFIELFYSKKRQIFSLYCLLVLLVSSHFSLAQPEGASGGGTPDDPFVIEPDLRAEQRSYYYEEAEKELPYVVYVSSKVNARVPSPLIVALHGMGGDGNFLVRNKMVDLAEEQGYILVAPMGYHVAGWYGSPVISIPRGSDIKPDNLAELSEGDVLNVLAMIKEEFTIDPDKTYLMGHSMGGAGTLYLGQKYAENWAALAAIAPAAFLMLPEKENILSPLLENNIPVMVIQGDEDTAVPAEYTHQWIESMETIGLEHEYIELEGGDHGTVIEDGMADIFRFFADHTRTK